MLLSKPTNVTVVVDTAVANALNDVCSLTRSEIRGETLLEYCIHRYFGSTIPLSLEQILGYSDPGYLTDEELDLYQEDRSYLNQCVERLLELLHPHLKCVVELGGSVVDVKVEGRIALIKFI